MRNLFENKTKKIRQGQQQQTILFGRLLLILLLLPNTSHALQTAVPQRSFLSTTAVSTRSTRLAVHPLEEDLTLAPRSDDVGEWSAMSSWGATLLQLR
eukprot:CAMPEP_0119023964 /NCGR_PEP_ID=MMETSP1176-20130426/30987_1 /TAXON_ID=265551 /ORGANISM="Synedropsis recta cf, Strain CCMP1620" /LENGTH=97 /DNA_ID=CAMNT_0006979137 /DNA_START=38 /DNA_END=327 /DNA_ORIENTATION=-